jgi:hypothetical protein
VSGGPSTRTTSRPAQRLGPVGVGPTRACRRWQRARPRERTAGQRAGPPLESRSRSCATAAPAASAGRQSQRRPGGNPRSSPASRYPRLVRTAEGGPLRVPRQKLLPLQRHSCGRYATPPQLWPLCCAAVAVQLWRSAATQVRPRHSCESLPRCPSRVRAVLHEQQARCSRNMGPADADVGPLCIVGCNDAAGGGEKFIPGQTELPILGNDGKSVVASGSVGEVDLWGVSLKAAAQPWQQHRRLWKRRQGSARSAARATLRAPT